MAFGKLDGFPWCMEFNPCLNQWNPSTYQTNRNRTHMHMCVVVCFSQDLKRPFRLLQKLVGSVQLGWLSETNVEQMCCRLQRLTPATTEASWIAQIHTNPFHSSLKSNAPCNYARAAKQCQAHCGGLDSITMPPSCRTYLGRPTPRRQCEQDEQQLKSFSGGHWDG